MANHLRKFVPGDKIPKDHATWNAIIEAARQATTLPPSEKGAPSRSGLPYLPITVRNATGGARSRGHIVAISQDDPSTLPTDDEYIAQAEPIFTGAVPNSSTSAVAILTEPIPASEYGEAAVSGLAVATVTCIDPAHTYCEPIASSSIYLASSSKGSIRVLWHPEWSPAGSHLCIVHLGPGIPPPIRWRVTGATGSPGFHELAPQYWSGSAWADVSPSIVIYAREVQGRTPVTDTRVEAFSINGTWFFQVDQYGTSSAPGLISTTDQEKAGDWVTYGVLRSRPELGTGGPGNHVAETYAVAGGSSHLAYSYSDWPFAPGVDYAIARIDASSISGGVATFDINAGTYSGGIPRRIKFDLFPGVDPVVTIVGDISSGSGQSASITIGGLTLDFVSGWMTGSSGSVSLPPPPPPGVVTGSFGSLA